MLLGPAKYSWRFRASAHVGLVVRTWVVAPLLGLHVAFAHLSVFGLGSVSQQCQSSRSTRLHFDWEESEHVSLLPLPGRDVPSSRQS